MTTLYDDDDDRRKRRKKRVERNNVGVFEKLVGSNTPVGMVSPPSLATNDNSPLYEDEEGLSRVIRAKTYVKELRNEKRETWRKEKTFHRSELKISTWCRE